MKNINILVLLIVALRIVNYFYQSLFLQGVTAVILILIIIPTIIKQKKSNKVVFLALFATGSALLISANKPPEVWLKVFLQNGNIAALLASVSFISTPFYYKDYQEELKKFSQTKIKSPMSFLILLSIVSHFISVAMSIGAMVFLYHLLKPFGKLYQAEKTFLTTLQRSYVTSGFWSPAWASVIVFSAFPEIPWVRVIPAGIFLAFVFNVLNLLSVYISMIKCPTCFPQIDSKGAKEADKPMLFEAFVLLVTMIVSIVVLNLITKWDLTLVVIIISFLFPLIAGVVMKKQEKFMVEIKNYFNVSLYSATTQVTLFVLAGFLGKAMEEAGASAVLTSLLPEWIKAYPPLVVLTITLMMIIPSFVGIHPAATGTAIIASIVPTAIGINSGTFVLTVLFGWLITILVAPFSAIAVMFAPYENKSTYGISIGLNWKFMLVCLLVFSLLIPLVGSTF